MTHISATTSRTGGKKVTITGDLSVSPVRKHKDAIVTTQAGTHLAGPGPGVRGSPRRPETSWSLGHWEQWDLGGGGAKKTWFNTGNQDLSPAHTHFRDSNICSGLTLI